MNKFTLVATALMLPAFAFAGKQQVKPLDAPVAKVAASSEIESYTWKDLGEGTFSDFVLSNLFVGIFNEPVKVMVQESEQKTGCVPAGKSMAEKRQRKFQRRTQLPCDRCL